MRALLAPSALLPLLLLLILGTPAARGDDAPADESAAAKAYRDAWWAETGGGNLTQALDLYAKAVEADGPPAVKALALYRRAVVLQRVGKTEEAIRTLERLAKEFPGEAQPNTDARARLAEWTAVDLRSSFSDWFKRYQYSPEFQAKVVDLVLKLGASDGAAVVAAQSELLTIGAASIPALQEHVSSRNTGLALRAQSLLLLLGQVPDTVVDLTNSSWCHDARSWVAVLGLPEARREALRARVGTGSWGHDFLRAALTGADAVVSLLATPGDDGQRTFRIALLQGLGLALPKDAPALERAADLALAAGQPEETRKALGEWTLRAGRLTPQRVRAWASHDSASLRELAWRQIESGAPLAPAEAWPLVLSGIERYAGKHWPDGQGLANAFLTTLEAAPWPQALPAATEAVLKARGGLGRTAGSPRYAQVLARVFDVANEEATGTRALGEWSQIVRADADALGRLGAWSRSAEPAWRRKNAAARLTQLAVKGPDLAPLLDYLVDPTVPLNEVSDAWESFFVAGSTDAGRRTLDDPVALRRLVDRVWGVDPGRSRQKMARCLAPYRPGGTFIPDPLLGVLLAAPERIPFELFEHGQVAESLRNSALLDTWRGAWRAAWGRWTPQQRTPALTLAAAVLQPTEDAAMAAFLRERLRARPVEIEPESRYRALSLLARPTLEDVQAVYDLSSAADADEAADFLRPGSVGFRRLTPTPEVFRALRLALRPEGRAEIAEAMGSAFGGLADVEPELIAGLLAHNDPSVHAQAAALLTARSSPGDESLWLRALGDAQVPVRLLAAKGMERVPTDKVKRALVGALDDPHPDVRAAALASLENIEKLEQLKARWREKVR